MNLNPMMILQLRETGCGCRHMAVTASVSVLVGLEDMVLSALVQEQVEGITPDAIALMTPKKMAVCVYDYETAFILFCCDV